MQRTEPIVWLNRRAFLRLHEASLAEHGGLQGFRDEGLFDSAIVRPQQVLNYREDASLAELGAAYAYGIARNHPFADGNKRAAYIAMDTFCQLNGWEIGASEAEIFTAMLALAAGELAEEQLAAWVGQHLRRLEAAP